MCAENISVFETIARGKIVCPDYRVPLLISRSNPVQEGERRPARHLVGGGWHLWTRSEGQPALHVTAYTVTLNNLYNTCETKK